jgi:hypothetical protein
MEKIMNAYVLVIIILVPAVLLAPASRIYQHHSRVGQQIDQPTVGSEVDYPNLIKIGSRAAANQGPYKIRGYQHRSCAGSIALLTLYRNAEGSHILKAMFNDEDMSYGVIYNAKVFSHFPQWEFTLQRISDKFRSLFRPYKGEPTSYPMAFAEKGACNIAESLTVSITQNAKTFE